MTLRRPSLSLSRTLSLAVVFFGSIGVLAAGYLVLFNKTRTLTPFSQPTVIDALLLSFLTVLAGLYLYSRPPNIKVLPRQAHHFGWQTMTPLAILILLAAFFRFHQLGFESLWADEIATLQRLYSSTPTLALENGFWQDAWPAYHLPLYGFMRLAGDSEFALRFPSALAGILLVPILFVLGSRLFSAREGLLAAGLAVSLNTPVWYSQETRSYAFVMAFAACSGYFWFRLAQDFASNQVPRRLSLLGYVVSLILLIYSQYFGLILIAIEGLGTLVLAVSMRRVPRSFVASYAALGMAYLPWLPLLLSDMSKSAFWILKPKSITGSGFAFLTFLFDSPLDIIVLGLAVVGIAGVLWNSFRRRDDDAAPPLAVTPGVVLIAWFVLPFAIAYWRSVMATPVLLDRYLLVSLPAAYLLLARAIARLPVPRLGQTLVGVGVVLYAIATISLGPYYTASNKPELRQAIQYIASRDTQYPDALIVGSSDAIAYYYPRFSATSVADLEIAPLNEVLARQAIANLQPRYIWFMGQRFLYNRSLPDSLAGDYVQRDEQEFHLVSLLLYERK